MKLTEEEMEYYLKQRISYKKIAKEIGEDYTMTRNYFNNYIEEKLNKKYFDTLLETHKEKKPLAPIKKMFYEEDYKEDILDNIWEKMINKYYKIISI